MSNTVTSYRISKEVDQKVNHYKQYFFTRKSKIITFAFYEMFSKDPIDIDSLAQYIKQNCDKIELDEVNKSISLRDEYLAAIYDLKSKVENILNTKLYLNRFVGYLLEYYFTSMAFYLKKNQFIADPSVLEEKSQVGIYVNTEVKTLLSELSSAFNLPKNMIVLDSLHINEQASFFETHKTKDEIGIDTFEKERIILNLPHSVHQKLKELPFSFSPYIDIKLFDYIREYSLFKLIEKTPEQT